MVVVFILGLLVTLVAPKVMGRTDEAKRTKAAADLRAVQQALNLYRLDNGGYPTTDQGLQALVSKPQSGTIPARWNPEGYLEKVQTDPWGHPYMYLSNGERYTLKSLGADGVDGGEGKYADRDSRDLSGAGGWGSRARGWCFTFYVSPFTQPATCKTLQAQSLEPQWLLTARTFPHAVHHRTASDSSVATVWRYW
jgi:general secretion pathway protein G